jgi:UDP-3-O-[3-hydroxymyristoyl] glucosamine N-acyltransferase
MNAFEIAKLVKGELLGDGQKLVENFADIERSIKGDLAFWEKNTPFETNASVVMVSKDFVEPVSATIIKVDDPKLAFAMIFEVFNSGKTIASSLHTRSIIANDSVVGNSYIGAFVTIGNRTKIGNDCQIHTGSRIGSDVVIGDHSIIFPNCVIYDDVNIGKRFTLHSGSVIGADGFGYVKDVDGKYRKFPQIGAVVIGNDVEIGANTCIDRGSLGETRVGDGTKIDNLVQIAHNVQIGKNVVIAAQTGISGSTTIEDDCVIGGQVGMGDHAHVLAGTVIGSQAGVLPGKIVRKGVWWGTPVQPLDEYKRQNAMVKGLSRLRKEVKDLSQKLERFTKSS